MNIARSLERPAVPRSKKRRRMRRMKLISRLFVGLGCALAIAYACYWTALGIRMLWTNWVFPTAVSAWEAFEQMPSSERYMWIRQLGWAAVAIGVPACWWACRRESRLAHYVTLVCFTYSYAFLSHASWLVLKSFFEMSRWSECAFIGGAVIGFFVLVRKARFPRAAAPHDEASS